MLIGPAGKQVNFAEQAGEQRKSPTFRFAPEAAQTQRSLFMPYTNDVSKVFSGAMALLGYSQMAGDLNGPGGTARRWIERILPASIPAFKLEVNPSLVPYMFCTSVPLVEPFSRPGAALTNGLSNYEWWRFATVWETPSYDIKTDTEVLAAAGPLSAGVAVDGIAKPDEGDALRRGLINTRWITRQVDPGSHAQTLRAFGRFCTYEAHGDTAIPEGYTTTISRAVVTYTHHCIPGYAALPYAAIQNALGTLNQDTFDTMPSSTAMLSDAKIRTYRDSFGQRLFDASFTMIYRPLVDSVTGINWGWNGLLRVVDGKMRVWPISADGALPTGNTPAGRALKAYSDFGALFRPPQG